MRFLRLRRNDDVAAIQRHAETNPDLVEIVLHLVALALLRHVGGDGEVDMLVYRAAMAGAFFTSPEPSRGLATMTKCVQPRVLPCRCACRGESGPMSRGVTSTVTRGAALSNDKVRTTTQTDRDGQNDGCHGKEDAQRSFGMWFMRCVPSPVDREGQQWSPTPPRLQCRGLFYGRQSVSLGVVRCLGSKKAGFFGKAGLPPDCTTLPTCWNQEVCSQQNIRTPITVGSCDLVIR